MEMNLHLVISLHIAFTMSFSVPKIFFFETAFRKLSIQFRSYDDVSSNHPGISTTSTLPSTACITCSLIGDRSLSPINWGRSLRWRKWTDANFCDRETADVISCCKFPTTKEYFKKIYYTDLTRRKEHRQMSTAHKRRITRRIIITFATAEHSA